LRRAVTLPSSAVEFICPYSNELALPDTPEVRELCAHAGPMVTFLDVALGIVSRLIELPGTHPAELSFLRGCLRAGSTETSVPCGLIQPSRNVKHFGVEEFLLNTYSNSAYTPSASGRSRATLRTVRSKSTLSEEEELNSDVDEEVDGHDAMKVEDWLGLSPEATVLLDAEFDTWGFDMFTLAKLTQRPLEIAGWEAMRRGGLFAELPIQRARARHFFELVESKYADAQCVPYHNNIHAADVTQSVHALLCDMGLDSYFDSIGRLALVLGAIVHDMGHDGRSNAFHINSCDGLALTYNDRSVLENYHVSMAFRLLMGEADANLLSAFGKEQVARVRKEVIDIVLGTDMANHFNSLSTFKGLVDRLDEGRDVSALSSLQSLVLHAADISTPSKPIAISDRWTGLLQCEFFLQGDEEKRLKLPVSPLCDRDTVNFARSQVAFIQFIVQPVFAALADLAPRVESIILTELSANSVVWNRRKVCEAEECENLSHDAAEF